MARTRSNDPAISLKFGDALKDARTKTGLTHEELARRIEKSVGALSMYESGQRFPPKTTFEAIEKEIQRDLRKGLRDSWEEGRVEWRKFKRASKSSSSSGKLIPLIKLMEELGEVETIRDYLELPKELRDAFRGFLKALPDVPVPKDKTPSIVLKFEKKKAS